MPDLKEECFCRLQLLSTKGVTPVLVKVLENIVLKTCNGDIDKILKAFQKEILELKKKKRIYEPAYQLLFPNNGKTDITTWDISLLTCILSNLCTLEGRCNKHKLIQILEKEAANCTGIQAFLATNKGRLDQTVKHQISDNQYDQIFPKSGINVDIKTWDFDVLLLVLAVCCTGVRSKTLNDQGKQLLIMEIALSQYNSDLAAFLKYHSKRLNELRQNGTISIKEYELMFPTKAIDPDINTWDQWLLVIVILNVCPHLQQTSIKAIQSLRSTRNEAIAHASSPEIEEGAFRVVWKNIVEAIEVVIENEIQGNYLLQWKDSISHIRSGPLNKQESIDILKQWYEDRNKTSEKLTETNEKLTETNKMLAETNENVTKLQQNVVNISEKVEEIPEMHREIKEIKDAIKQPKQELEHKLEIVSHEKPEVFTAHVEIQCIDVRVVIKGNDVAAARKAEDIIRQAIDEEKDVTKKDAVAYFTAIQLESVTRIKKAITQWGSTILEVVQGSIIIRVQCHTLKQLQYLLHYDTQLLMNRHFDELATATGPIVGDTIQINAGITDYSLDTLNDDVSRICLKNDIELPLLVEDDNQHILEATADSKSDICVGTTDDPPPVGPKPLLTKSQPVSGLLEPQKSDICVGTTDDPPPVGPKPLLTKPQPVFGLLKPQKSDVCVSTTDDPPPVGPKPLLTKPKPVSRLLGTQKVT